MQYEPSSLIFETPIKKRVFNSKITLIPVGIYLFKGYNRNTRARCEICSKLTIKTPERRQWRLSGVISVNFEHISHFVLVFLLLTFSKQMSTGYTTQYFNN